MSPKSSRFFRHIPDLCETLCSKAVTWFVIVIVITSVFTKKMSKQHFTTVIAAWDDFTSPLPLALLPLPPIWKSTNCIHSDKCPPSLHWTRVKRRFEQANFQNYPVGLKYLLFPHNHFSAGWGHLGRLCPPYEGTNWYWFWRYDVPLVSFQNAPWGNEERRGGDVHPCWCLGCASGDKVDSIRVVFSGGDASLMCWFLFWNGIYI